MSHNSIMSLDKKSFYIETYGCQMNKAESLTLMGELIKIGYIPAQNPEQAHWVVLNTCSVRKTAEDKVLGRLGFLKTLKKSYHFKIAVMGCMGERLKEVLATTYEVDAIIGNFNKKIFIERLRDDIESPRHNSASHATYYPFNAPKPSDKKEVVTYGVLAKQYDFFDFHHSSSPTQALVPIMHGCNHFCTFCIVPYVRGREISRDPTQIIAELQKHVDAGIKEITLLGQNVNSFHHEKIDFAQLLKQISLQLKGHAWLRFISSHPKDMKHEILEILNADPRFARHLHLAVQHANNRLLTEMNRQHTKEDFLNLVKHIRQCWSHVTLTTDIMIGFPSETDNEFEELLDFLEIVQFDNAFTYQYNDREGTPSARRTDKVSANVKKIRIQKLIAVQRDITQRKLSQKIGETSIILIEGIATKYTDHLFGRNEHNHNIIIPANKSLIGQFVPVQIESLIGQTFVAKILDGRQA